MRLKVAVAVAASAIALIAQPARAAVPTGTLRLVGQSTWVERGAEFVLRVVPLTKDTADLEVAVTISPKVGSRSEFVETLDGKVRGSPISVRSTPLADLPVDPDGAITVRLPIQDPSQRQDPARILLRGAGIYPVAVELRELGGGRSVDRFVTHLVNLPDPVSGAKLESALILPVAAPPSWQRDGTRRLAAGWPAAIDALATTIASNPGVPVTLLPQADTLQALAESSKPAERDALDEIVKAAATRAVIAAPYVRIYDGSYTNGLESEQAAQRHHGADAASAVLGRPVDTATAVVDSLDDGAVTRLSDEGVTRIIARDRAMAPMQLRLTLTQPFQLRGRQARHVPAMAADDGLAADFTRAVPPALAAHQLLADLAVLYFDTPGRARGVVAMPAAGWRADPAFLSTLFEGLRANPLVEPVDVSRVFDVSAATGPNRGLLLRDPAPASAAPPLPATELRRARRQLNVLDGLTDTPNPALVALDERLLATQSADLRARDRSDDTTAVERAINGALASIRVPANVSITLTARRGEIPVTVRRDVGYPVHVVLQLTSDKLSFPSGSSASLFLTLRNTTTLFTVQARTSGTFPLQVIVRAPDGRTVLSRGRITVRSRAASYVGVIVSGGALLFLVLWWGRHIRQSRRANKRAAGARSS